MFIIVAKLAGQEIAANTASDRESGVIAMKDKVKSYGSGVQIKVISV